MKHHLTKPVAKALKLIKKPSINAFDYMTSYHDLVGHLSAIHPKDKAMELSVGGHFGPIGALEILILEKFGLKEDSHVVDVGCGSGRLASRLKDHEKLTYLGTDVVQELLDHADKLCGRSDFVFEKVTDLVIPEKDEKADIVCMFSVITHLMAEQCYVYLEEAKRVIKPEGRIIFSFLEFSTLPGWDVFEANLSRIRDEKVLENLGNTVVNTFLHPEDIKVWAEHLDLEVEFINSGGEKFLTAEDGRFGEDLADGDHGFGQSLCVLKKKK